MGAITDYLRHHRAHCSQFLDKAKQIQVGGVEIYDDPTGCLLLGHANKFGYSSGLPNVESGSLRGPSNSAKEN
jgi:hypothetical protein